MPPFGQGWPLSQGRRERPLGGSGGAQGPHGSEAPPVDGAGTPASQGGPMRRRRVALVPRQTVAGIEPVQADQLPVPGLLGEDRCRR